MTLLKSEINAVVKVLNQDWEGATSQDVALAILETVNALREKNAKWVTVGRLMLPNGHWHNFATGPYSTILQAQRAGEGFTHDPKTRTGEGGYRAVPVVSKARDAWDSIRPEHVDHKDWIKEQIQAGVSGLDWNERSEW